MNELRQRMLSVLSEFLEIDQEQLSQVNQLAELNIDSLGLIDLITHVEAAFSVRIPNELLDNLKSLDDLVNAVASCEEFNHA